VEPLRVNVVAGMAGDRWSMLYRTAASLSASVVEILITIRSPPAPGGACGGGCSVPCQVPVILWAETRENEAPPDNAAKAQIHSQRFFMNDLPS
jgi:hypothetical protein